MCILTITPNPAIDQTIRLEHLTPGQVHRAESVLYNAGGKGVNVSSCLADWGLSSSLSGFLGRENAVLFEGLCRSKNLTDRFIRIDGQVRTNIKMVDDVETTDINLPGAAVKEPDIAQLVDIINGFGTLGVNNALLIMAGSLPPGCPVDLYRRIVTSLKDTKTRIIVDADGPALAEVLSSKYLPYAIKPNQRELASWAGKELLGPEAIVKQARELVARGLRLVVVSLGGDGAIFVNAKGALLAKMKAESIVSTVGAGDAMVAGISAAVADRADLERIARLSTAFSIAKLGLLGPNLLPKEAVEALAKQVVVESLG